METAAAALRDPGVSVVPESEAPQSVGVPTTGGATQTPAAASRVRAPRSPARLRPRGGLGGYLNELRRERGLTVRQLAAAAGVHHTYVSKLERGDRQAPEEPVVESLAAALGVSPAQLDQLRWRAGLTPRGSGAPGQDDPTLTLVAEALGNPALTDPARDQLRRAIAQAVQGPVGAPAFGAAVPSGGYAAGLGAAPGPWAGQPAGTSYPAGLGTAPASPAGPWAIPPAGNSAPIPPAPAMPPGAGVLSPEAPPDTRTTMLAGLLGGWQTVDEAAAELRVTSAYLLSLVQVGQLRAWALPGGLPGSPAGVRLRRDDVLALLQPLQPVRL